MSDKYTYSKKRKKFIKTAVYEAYCNALQRCTNPTAPAYSYYGGRGIKVTATFAQLFAVLGHRPSKNLTLGRICNDGDYSVEPLNVEWQTWSQQMSNRRRKSTPVTCPHKDARHRAHGLCDYCYNRDFRTKAIKAKSIKRRAKRQKAH